MKNDEFLKKMAEPVDFSEAKQKDAGVPLQDAKLGDTHATFLQTVIQLIESKEIDINVPESFLKQDVYEQLDEQWKEKTNLALVNIATQIRMIYDYYTSTETPNDSLQLKNMVDHLWEMKERIEMHHDVFKF